MKRHRTLVVMLGFLLICLAPNADAVTIHDVVIGTTSLGPVDDTGTPGCAKLDIGTTGAGTDYGNFKIKSANGTDPASIQAIENGASCFSRAPDSVRDRLLLVNADIIVNQSGANTALILDYQADFGSSPDGYNAYGGFMKGKFKKNNAGVSCGPLGFTCKVTFDTAIYSQYDTLWHQLPQVSSLNPVVGVVNKAIPPTNIQVGTNLARTHHSLVTVYLPYDSANVFKLSITGSESFTLTNHTKKTDTDIISKWDGISKKIDPDKYYKQFKDFKLPGVGPDPGGLMPQR